MSHHRVLCPPVELQLLLKYMKSRALRTVPQKLLQSFSLSFSYASFIFLEIVTSWLSIWLRIALFA